MIETEDNRLISEILEGKIASFDKLVKKYQKQIFNLCKRMLKDTDDAKDITQIVFVKAYNGLDSYNQNTSFLVGYTE